MYWDDDLWHDDCREVPLDGVWKVTPLRVGEDWTEIVTGFSSAIFKESALLQVLSPYSGIQKESTISLTQWQTRKVNSLTTISLTVGDPKRLLDPGLRHQQSLSHTSAPRAKSTAQVATPEEYSGTYHLQSEYTRSTFAHVLPEYDSPLMIAVPDQPPFR